MDRIGRDPEGILESARFIRDLVRRAPGRLYGSCCVNPNFLDPSLRTMEACFGEWGFVQMNHASSHGMGQLRDLFGLVRRVPDAHYILAHAVGPPFLPYGTIFGVAGAEDNPYPPSIASMVAFLKRAGADDETVERIGYRNAAELLRV